MVIAATPVLFALVTWNAANAINPGQAWLRLFGVPVVVVELGIIAYAVLAGASPLRIIGRQPIWVQAILLLLVGIAVLTALLGAPARVDAATWTVIWLVHLLFGICVAGLVRLTSARARELIWPMLVAGLCGYALILIVYVNAVPNPRTFPWERFWLGVTNIRQVGFFSAAGAAAALGLAITQRDRGAVLSFAAATLLLALSFWTGTRGSLLAVWAAFAVGLFLVPDLRSARSFAVLAGITAAGAVLSLVQPVPYGLYGLARLAASAGHTTVEEVSSGRSTMWALTWDTILERPLFGYGAGQFRWVADESLRMFNHPHNVVLQLLVQWGFVGTLCFGALALFVAGRCREALRNASAETVPAFLAAASLLILSLYDGAFYYSYPIMMIALSLAVLSGAQREAERA